MTNLSDTLSAAGIRKALIVDDAYDASPVASDLAHESSEWDIFFADVNDADRGVLRSIYPKYEQLSADQLRGADEFVAALWRERLRVRSELIGPLFQRYVESRDLDLERLAKLQAQLAGHGLECKTIGREFITDALTADLIFMDLFLGSSQTAEDQQASIKGVFQVIEQRRNSPPLLVLMSNSTRLERDGPIFRDGSGLFESNFEFIGKRQLEEERYVERRLYSLAYHYKDSLKLVKFVNAWKAGISRAGENVSRMIQKLDLSEHAIIQRLLLDLEGQPTGSFFVELLDRVLLHEVEGDRATIDAAQDLNTLARDAWPPHHGQDALDLQDLVHRSQFQNVERLRLKGDDSNPVVLGDVLRRKRQTGPPSVSTEASGGGWPGAMVGVDEVLVVLTPACDLVRLEPDKAQSILLLVGKLEPLASSEWYPTGSSPELRTPVVVLDGNRRFSINWNTKHFDTIQPKELVKALASEGGVEIIARLRETHALELQQRLLSTLGRVGQLGAVPTNYTVQIESFYVNTTGALTGLGVSASVDQKGVCYVGKGSSRFMLNGQFLDALCEATRSLDLALVHERARPTVERLRSTDDLWLALRSGSSLPEKPGAQPTTLYSATWTDDSGKPKGIGLISRNPEHDTGKQLKSNLLPNAGVFLVVRDPQVATADGVVEALVATVGDQAQI